MKSRNRGFCLLLCCCLLVGSIACGQTTENPPVGATPTGEIAGALKETGETPDMTPTEGAMPTEVPTPTKGETPTKMPIPTPTIAPELTETSIRLEAEKCGFTFGTVVNAWTVRNKGYQGMVEAEFGSITAANEMKAYSLLDQAASQKEETGMPVMNYTEADRIVNYAQSIGIGVRGHVLVWDAYMCDWFFREGYQNDGDYVDRETCKARVRYYIEEVITHFETEFPGVVYCWDVVNEAVGDSTGEYSAEDARHLRTMRSGSANLFYQIMGSDYVELAFLYARDTVERLQKEKPEVSILLFYNDYNTFYEEKRNAICALLESINSYAKDEAGNERLLCDGIGMQSYIGGYGQQSGCMNSEDIRRIKEAVRKYHALGLQVHVTEMAVRNYDKKQEEKHAAFYGELFAAYAQLNAKEPLITNITIWGICDNPTMPKTDYSYKMNSPYCGLFTQNYARKNAYYQALEAIMKKEEPAKMESGEIPVRYTKLNLECTGRIEEISYQTYDYYGDGAPITKSAFVYLPPQYEESRQYNVLYLMHGIGGNEREWGMTGNLSEVKKMMDNLTAYGDIEPFLIVTPNGRSGADFANTNADYNSFYLFGKELRNDLIPYIDAHYATYADYQEGGYDLTQARDHRAMAGLSMGGMQTINIGLCECLDILSWYGAFSAAPTSNPADVIAKKLQEFPEEYDIHYFYNICGTGDQIAFSSAKNAVQGLTEKTDRLSEGSNFLWQEVAGVHDFHVWYLGFYNFAQLVFQKQK